MAHKNDIDQPLLMILQAQDGDELKYVAQQHAASSKIQSLPRNLHRSRYHLRVESSSSPASRLA